MNRQNQIGILLAVALATLVGLLVVHTLTWHQEKQKLEADLLIQAMRSANTARALVLRRAQNGRTVLRGAAASAELQEGLALRSAEKIDAGLSTFGREFAGMHIVITDPGGHPIGWSSPLAILSLDRSLPDSGPESGWRRVAGELALTVKQPIEAAGRRLGTLHAAIIVDRDFVHQLSDDLGAPIAIATEDELLRHTFPGEIENSAQALAGELIEVGGLRYALARVPLSFDGKRSPSDAWLYAAEERAPIAAARARYVRIGGVTAGVGLLITLLGVGGYLTVASRRERQLIAQRDAAETLSRGLSDRVSHLTAVVHDIKAPLSGIQLRAESLIEDTDDDELRSALQMTVETCEKMNLYLVNVLTAAQAEQGPLVAREETILLPGLLEELVERVHPVSVSRSVQVVTRAEPALPAVVADSTLLERALLNLAYNALAVSKPGQTVTLFARKSSDSTVVVGVEDEGPGWPFPPEKAFSRSRPQVKHHSIKAGSSGLGLYIVEQIARALGGTARAENLTPSGARAQLELPLP